jgi:hypothetical protein
MDYVALLTLRSAVSSAERDAGLSRRASWQYPAGIRLIAEYWPMGAGPNVVSIFSTDNPESIMEIYLEWSDIFDIEVHPALSAEDGLRVGAQVMPNLARLKG